jgi:hypothetical protein
MVIGTTKGLHGEATGINGPSIYENILDILLNFGSTIWVFCYSLISWSAGLIQLIYAALHRNHAKNTHYLNASLIVFLIYALNIIYFLYKWKHAYP